MKIPDETLYKEGEKHIEDIEGWVYCCHCAMCNLKYYDQIYPYGMFFCFHLKQWKDGEDLVEYKCEGFIPKSCKNCRSSKSDCTPVEEGYCNKYRNNTNSKKSALSLVGRRRLVETMNKTLLDFELRYQKNFERRFIDESIEEMERREDD